MAAEIQIGRERYIERSVNAEAYWQYDVTVKTTFSEFTVVVNISINTPSTQRKVEALKVFIDIINETHAEAQSIASQLSAAT